jgi:hypothetical protein
MTIKKSVAATPTVGEKGQALERSIAIRAPNFETVVLQIIGTSPYVQHKFSAKAEAQIKATQEAGTVAKGKKAREPKDFDAVYEGAIHRSREGWIGIPASSFRNAMISACRTVGFKMTHAKLAAFILADGFDRESGDPLVKIDGTPRKHMSHARNDNGSLDLRCRPMWETWGAEVRIRFDADMFSSTDVSNLMMRVGMQVGIGEGRPDSRNSAGMGWGMFNLQQGKQLKKVAA